MNIWDILILLAVSAAVLAAVFRVRGRGKAGRCGCGCEGCTLCNGRSCKRSPDR